jgi:uncharacterized protein
MERQPVNKSSLIAAGALVSIFLAAPANAASFDCAELDRPNAAEKRICASPWLGSLDERLDSWYRRALVRARYFDQTREVRGEQRAWLASRNSCGANFWCLRRHYVSRIRELKSYVEHV